MQIYSDYDEEPRDQFEPLPADLYRELYDLELVGFDLDIAYYLRRLKGCRTVLELGCGSGRIASQLQSVGYRITGIDLSLPMLTAAQRGCPAGRFACMDMRHLALHPPYDAIIIGYNTLNLLTARDDLQRCMGECYRLLHTGGRLLLQLYVPDENQPSQLNTSFQFQVLDRPQGGKIVKEVLRTLHPDRQILTMEERYKIRPPEGKHSHRNFSHTLTLTCAPKEFWQTLLETSGFTIHSMTSAYNDNDTPSPSLLMVEARKRQGLTTGLRT